MIKVNVLLADGFEEIEALVDLLRRAQVYVGTVSVMDDYMVHGAHGISVQAEDLFDEVDFAETDALILPGGMPGTTNLKEHEGVRKVTAELAEKGKIIGAICAAPTVLSDLGLLKGKRVTCYPSVETDIQGAVMSDGNIITSRGAGTAIDFALELIAVLVGKERALSVAESIVYR